MRRSLLVFGLFMVFVFGRERIVRTASERNRTFPLGERVLGRNHWR